MCLIFKIKFFSLTHILSVLLPLVCKRFHSNICPRDKMTAGHSNCINNLATNCHIEIEQWTLVPNFKMPKYIPQYVFIKIQTLLLFILNGFRFSHFSLGSPYEKFHSEQLTFVWNFFCYNQY